MTGWYALGVLGTGFVLVVLLVALIVAAGEDLFDVDNSILSWLGLIGVAAVIWPLTLMALVAGSLGYGIGRLLRQRLGP